MKDLNKFYGIKWTFGRPNVIIARDRKQIDELKDIKTERWLIGWASGQFVYLLDRKTYNKESEHTYNEKFYRCSLRHELSHAFYAILSDRRTSPVWLCEGVAIYTSGQNNLKKKPDIFKTFLNFYDKGGRGVYSESGFAVEILIRKYGKKKILNLISLLGTVQNNISFLKLFKGIYGFKPNYKNFNILLKEIIK
jgi:hypothetical protein